jgi:branched-chain amino acid aminotransferase
MMSKPTTITEPVVYVNGEFFPKSEAKISVFDQGLIFGDAVFDTLIAANGFIFKLDEHVARLQRSARAVKIEIGKTDEEIKHLIIETVRRSNLRDAYIKIIVTRGISSKPLMGKGDISNPSIVIFAIPPVSVVTEEAILKGAKLISSTIMRGCSQGLDPRIKSTNYLPNMLMRREAGEAGADEAICYDHDGNVAEGGAENIWIVNDNKLFTPSHGMLEGITRETIFEIARDLKLSTMATDIKKYDLYVADEIFLCSTAGGIIPVTSVDNRIIGLGYPGKITKLVMDKYKEMI